MSEIIETPHLADLIGLAIATAIGLLIGLEREEPDHHKRAAGIRTHALIGLLGGLGGLLTRPFGGWPLLAVAAPAAAILLVGRVGRNKGITTEIAGLVVLTLGFVSTAHVPALEPTRRWTLAAAAAVIALALLSTRGPLHRLADRVSREDLYATVRLGVLLVIVLPLLPQEQVGPIPGLVPFEVGLMIALIAAIGFVAYIGVRMYGARRGLVVAGGLGGLASSTAVTLEFSRRVRRQPSLAAAAAPGVTLAAAAMVPRQLIEVAVVAPDLLWRAAIPIGALGVVALVATYVGYRFGGGDARASAGADEDEDAREDEDEDEGAREDDEDDEDASPVDAVQNPSSLGSALKFGGIFVVVVALTELARENFGVTGLYLSALVGGLTDADAITLAVGRMWSGGDVEAGPAVTALVIGAGTNTLVKAAIGAVIGGPKLGLRLLAMLGPAVAVAMGLTLFL